MDQEEKKERLGREGGLLSLSRSGSWEPGSLRRWRWEERSLGWPKREWKVTVVRTVVFSSLHFSMRPPPPPSGVVATLAVVAVVVAVRE